MEEHATIYDVAKAAGVSPSTVSRAFSRPGRVSSKTAARIREVAEQLGYRTEELYLPEQGTRTKAIGLAVSDITNPFFFGIIKGAQSAADKAGYILPLLDAQESGEFEHSTLERAVAHLDGLVVASSRMSDTNLRAIARTVPTVVLNRHVQGLPSVVTDNPRGTRRAVEHLAELGHTKITYLAGPEASWPDGMRWRAVREAAHELSIHDTRLGPFPPTAAGGAAAAREVARRGCTAVIGYNDLMCMGLIRAFVLAGVALPDHLSAIGFDNIFATDLINPALTTVAAPLVMLGEMAIPNVVAIIGGARPSRAEAMVTPVRLIVRASTGPPRRGPFPLADARS